MSQPIYYRNGDKVTCSRCGRVVGRHNYGPARHKCPHGALCAVSIATSGPYLYTLQCSTCTLALDAARASEETPDA